MKKLSIVLCLCLSGCVTLGGKVERVNRGEAQTRSENDATLQASYSPPIVMNFTIDGENNTVDFPAELLEGLAQRKNDVTMGSTSKESSIYTWYNSLTKEGSILVALFIVGMVFGGVRLFKNILLKLHPAIDWVAHNYRSKRLGE